MSYTTGISKIGADAAEIETGRSSSAAASTKDTGKVKIGGSGIRFTDTPASTKDSGRVRVGGSGIRF